VRVNLFHDVADRGGGFGWRNNRPVLGSRRQLRGKTSELEMQDFFSLLPTARRTGRSWGGGWTGMGRAGPFSPSGASLGAERESLSETISTRSCRPANWRKERGKRWDNEWKINKKIKSPIKNEAFLKEETKDGLPAHSALPRSR
jgi:hypothetical protein